MKNVGVHFVADDPEVIGLRFTDIPKVGEFITRFDSGNNSLDVWFEVIAVIHLAFGEDSEFDQTNPFEYVAEIWLKKAVTPNEAIEKFSR